MRKLFYKFISITFYLFLLSGTINSLTWKPYQTFIDGNSAQTKLINKIIKQEPITYCIDEDDTSFEGVSVYYNKIKYAVVEDNKSYDTRDPEFYLQDWFKNVLKRAKKYPNFETEFADIIPILKNAKKMKKIPCGPNPKEYSCDTLKSCGEKYQAGEEVEDLRIVFSSQDLLTDALKHLSSFEEADGFYTILSDRKLIWIPKRGSNLEKPIMIHELGHMLGFADISHDKEKQAKEYGSSSENSIMSCNHVSLTCDDADGIVALLYLALGKDKIFHSFCDKNIIYKNGKVFNEQKELEENLQTVNMDKLLKFYEAVSTITLK